MRQLRYEINADSGRLENGRQAESGSESIVVGVVGSHYWTDDKFDHKKHWMIDENGNLAEATAPEGDAEEQALIAIEARQQYAPKLIAKISLKITTENVLLAERMTLNPLISTVTVLLQAGSFQDALAAINAQSTAGLSEAAINVLLYADETIQDAVDNY